MQLLILLNKISFETWSESICLIICDCNCVKVHKLFALLNLSHAYVTSLGQLVGVVALTEVGLVTL